MSNQAKGKVNEIVYEAYKPQKLGVIRSISCGQVKNRIFHVEVVSAIIPIAEVEFESGIKSIPVMHLQSFSELIKDHRKKLAGHRLRLKEFKAKFNL